MKLIDKILGKFGYVKESQVQADLAFAMKALGVDSLDDLKVKPEAFEDLMEVLFEPSKFKVGQLDTKRKMSGKELPSLQDKIDAIMTRNGMACSFDELNKEDRQKIFIESLSISDKIVD